MDELSNKWYLGTELIVLKKRLKLYLHTVSKINLRQIKYLNAKKKSTTIKHPEKNETCAIKLKYN